MKFGLGPAAVFRLALATLVAGSCSDMSVPPTPQRAPWPNPVGLTAESWKLSERFMLRLVRNSMTERECRLDIIVREDGSPVRLNCEYGTGLTTEQFPALAVSDVLTTSERARVVALANEANLFGGGHVGRDGSAHDAAFERLEALGDGNAFVVLITSGNPTFETEGPRRDLLTTVRAIERRLRTLGNAQPGRLQPGNGSRGRQ